MDTSDLHTVTIRIAKFRNILYWLDRPKFYDEMPPEHCPLVTKYVGESEQTTLTAVANGGRGSGSSRSSGNLAPTLAKCLKSIKEICGKLEGTLVDVAKPSGLWGPVA